MWDLITAAVEQANIELHNLTGKEAKKMRGRATITYSNVIKEYMIVLNMKATSDKEPEKNQGKDTKSKATTSSNNANLNPEKLGEKMPDNVSAKSCAG